MPEARRSYYLNRSIPTVRDLNEPGAVRATPLNGEIDAGQGRGHHDPRVPGGDGGVGDCHAAEHDAGGCGRPPGLCGVGSTRSPVRRSTSLSSFLSLSPSSPSFSLSLSPAAAVEKVACAPARLGSCLVSPDAARSPARSSPGDGVEGVEGMRSLGRRLQGRSGGDEELGEAAAGRGKRFRVEDEGMGMEEKADGRGERL
jgi:hypothetical protein